MKSLTIFLIFAVLAVLLVSFLLSQSQNTLFISDNEIKTKLNFTSLFDVYGIEDNFEIKDGKKIWYNPTFELNPKNNEIYSELNYNYNENTIVIFPIFTASAYNESGFYNYYREECDESCLTVDIDKEYNLHFISSGNGYQILKLLGYEVISDIDVDKNPAILEKYDKVILLHNEYVTKKEFDAIVNHSKVIYLYPNALYAEVTIDYTSNTMTLFRGHNFPESQIRNGFDWKFDNSILEYDIDCKEKNFEKIENGWMLNCYPENIIHQSKILLKTIKEF